MYTTEESARLLKAIFPNYPDLKPCLPAPPRELWLVPVSRRPFLGVGGQLESFA